MAERDQVYAVLIAIENGQLLLPNVAVSEVVSHEGLELNDSGPDWLLGSLNWNGRSIPALSFEALNGGSRPEMHRRTRFVIITALSRYVESGFIALLAQGYPNLVTLNRAAMVPTELDPNDRPELFLSRIKMAGTQAVIPDLEGIEADIARARSVEVPLH